MAREGFIEITNPHGYRDCREFGAEVRRPLLRWLRNVMVAGPTYQIVLRRWSHPYAIHTRRYRCRLGRNGHLYAA